MRITLILLLLFSIFNCFSIGICRKLINGAHFIGLFIVPCSLSAYGFKTSFDKVQEQQKQYIKHVSRFKELGARDKPIGIANTYGTCYVSATLQLLEAAYAAQPTCVDSLMGAADTGLVGAYQQARKSIYQQPRWNFEGIIDPTSFVEEWKRQNPASYGIWVLKKVKNADGLCSSVELCPDLAQKAIGGLPEELIARFVTECAGIAQKTKSSHVLSLVRLGNLNKLSMNLSDMNIANQDRTQFLVVHNNYRKQFVPSTDAQYVGQNSERYRLTAVIQRVTVVRDQLFWNSGGHVVCYVRYGEQWFKCDDHKISSISHEKLYTEFHEDACTSYEGRAQILGYQLVNPHPSLLLYVRE